MTTGETRARGLHIDLRPFGTSRDFRVLFASRTITLAGSQATEVALLVQARQLTGSAIDVGLLGAAELVPLVLFGLYGGVLADRLDRRLLARWTEAGLGGIAVLLAVNATLPRPAVWPLYPLAAATMALAALQRPSLDASVPRIVPRDLLAVASALLSLSGNASMIIGFAGGGALAAGPGPVTVYAADAVSFAVSFALLGLLRPLPARPAESAARRPRRPGVLAGLRYARRRQELVGSYLADLAAMTLAYPGSLFPFMAAQLHAPWSAGLMFSASSAGALAASAVSGWAGRVRRHGLAIAVAAAAWGAAIAGFGLAPGLGVALACLVVAGAADMFSGVFRDTLWNQTIPDALRGRLAGVEVLSYGLGPSAGQLRAGAVAAISTPTVSLCSGGLLCVAAVGVICAALPGFRGYRAGTAAAEGQQALDRRGVAADPVHAHPVHHNRPGPAHLQDAHHDQQPAADLHDQPGVPAGETEARHPALEEQGHDQERHA
jgi:MFS family permease